ncbi:MAG: DUF2142 domain-containing protein [Clostridia bacterium]|nr:DUF2142 domain-containing protein [Clostridia bacterium]
MKRKYLIYFITFIFALVATINISIGIYARQNVKYEIMLNSDIKIDNIVMNNTIIPRTRYLGENLFLDEDENICTNGTGKVTIVASEVDDLFINFIADDYHKITILKNGEKQILDTSLYMSKSSMKSVIMTSIQYVGIYFGVIFVISYVVLLICLYTFKKIVQKLKENTTKISDVLLFTGIIFLMYFLMFYVLLATFRIAVIVPLLAILIGGVYYFKNSLKDNLHNLYVYIAAIAGVTMLFVIPPFNVPDEGAHFRRSFMGSEIRSIGDNGRNTFPISVENIMFKYIHGSQIIETNYSGKNYFADMFETGDYGNLSNERSGYTNTKYLSAFTYIPSTIAIFIGKILHFSPLMLLLVGRFADLLVVICSCYFAIKRIPRFKKVIFCVALFPICLHQAAGINQDFMTNSIAILSITHILRLAYEKQKITRKDNLITLIFAVLLGLCKFGYFLIFLILLIIPREKYENQKTANLVLVLSLLVAFLISFWINKGNVAVKNSPYYTISEALSNPIDTIKIFFNTALDRFSLDIFRGLLDGFGISTIWHNGLFLFIITVIYATLLFSSDENDKVLNKKERAVFLVTAFLLMLVIYASLFIGWTFKGARAIDGLQPRYFIPIAFVFYIGLSNKKINLTIKNKNLFYAYGISIVYLISFATILLEVY